MHRWKGRAEINAFKKEVEREIKQKHKETWKYSGCCGCVKVTSNIMTEGMKA